MDSTEAAAVDYMSNVSAALISASSSKKERREAQAYAEEQSNLAYQRSIDQRDFSNWYNSPAEKKRRLEMAGISPWTEFGNMANTTDAIKPPIPPTMQPAEPLRLPGTNLFNQYIQLENMELQKKGLEASLVTQALENEARTLTNVALKTTIERELNRDIEFRAAQQAEALKEWERLNEKHKAWLKEMENRDEAYQYGKTLRHYDEKAREYDLELQRGNIARNWKALSQMDIESALLQQKYQLGYYGIESNIEQLNMLKDENKYKRFINDRNMYYMNQYGLNPNDQNLVNQIFMRVSKFGEKFNRNSNYYNPEKQIEYKIDPISGNRIPTY